FTRLIAYLRGLIAEGSALSPLNRYLLVRDITFFVIDFYTGDRASDLGRLKADQLFFRLKDREGFLLNFTFSKTRRAGQFRPFALLRIPNVPVCPYLKAANINDGETPHSYRVGISYTLKGLGCTPEQIA
ncbi:unnamed protein product, partial [Porites lobata]